MEKPLPIGGIRNPPVVMNTLLFPMKPEVKVHPTLSDIEVRTDPDVLGTGFTLQSHNTTDTFLISDDGLAEMSTADIRFVGEYSLLTEGCLRFRGSIRDAERSVSGGGSECPCRFDAPRESYVRM